MRSIEAVAMVDKVYGIPAAAAARAMPTSANGQPNPTPPVGPMAMGSFEREPRMALAVSICATPVSILGAAVEEIEDRARQPLFGEPPQVLYRPRAQEAPCGAPGDRAGR